MTNCWIVGCEESREGVVIDPGGDSDRILREIDHSGLAIRYVLNTHCHFDHIGANADVVSATGAQLCVHPAELPTLQAQGGAAWFGVRIADSPPPDVELAPGQDLTVGTLSLQVLHTPGHSPGSVTFYVPAEGVAFDGDTLFAGGVGRADLPGGDWDTLMSSIRDVLFALPDETALCPGHGAKTTVGRERRTNPWVRGVD
jgi:glyoxylase-like metal-dependent hydrolase (beta-lactamase superfamily II)